MCFTFLQIEDSDATSFTLEKLDPDTKYLMRVKAQNSRGTSFPSEVVEAETDGKTFCKSIYSFDCVRFFRVSPRKSSNARECYDVRSVWKSY